MIWNLEENTNKWNHEMAILNIKVAVLDVKWGKKGNKFAAGTGSKLVCTGFWCSDSNWWQCKNMKEHKSSVVSVCLDESGLFVISGSLDLKVIISSAYIDKIDDGENSTSVFDKVKFLFLIVGPSWSCGYEFQFSGLG